MLSCLLGLALPACRGSQVPPGSSSDSAGSRNTTFTTPPFSTREPDRYQAIRVTITETASTKDLPFRQVRQVLIARDGEKRREEHPSEVSGQIVYLEIPAGRFMLLPASREYADLKTVSDYSGRSEDSPGLSADQLLNEAQVLSTYENLGNETIDGRVTTKYRVVVKSGSDSQNETLMWIDETLGMPVRSESTSQAGGRLSKVTMELKDVRLEVDEQLFTLPADYRKVDSRLIFDQIREVAKPTVPGEAEK